MHAIRFGADSATSLSQDRIEHSFNETGSLCSTCPPTTDTNVCQKKAGLRQGNTSMDSGIYHVKNRIGINLIPVTVSQ
jgi:hypothetical protein